MDSSQGERFVLSLTRSPLAFCFVFSMMVSVVRVFTIVAWEQSKNDRGEFRARVGSTESESLGRKGRNEIQKKKKTRDQKKSKDREVNEEESECERSRVQVERSAHVGRSERPGGEAVEDMYTTRGPSSPAYDQRQRFLRPMGGSPGRPLRRSPPAAPSPPCIFSLGPTRPQGHQSAGLPERPTGPPTGPSAMEPCLDVWGRVERRHQTGGLAGGGWRSD